MGVEHSIRQSRLSGKHRIWLPDLNEDSSSNDFPAQIG